MATISTGCSIKPSANGNRSGLKFSHYCGLLDVVPVLLIVCFFSPATPHHYQLLSLYLNIINSREDKAAVISVIMKMDTLDLYMIDGLCVCACTHQLPMYIPTVCIYIYYQ